MGLAMGICIMRMIFFSKISIFVCILPFWDIFVPKSKFMVRVRVYFGARSDKIAVSMSRSPLRSQMSQMRYCINLIMHRVRVGTNAMHYDNFDCITVDP